MLKGMEGVMMSEVGGGKKEIVCAQLSCGDPQVGIHSFHIFPFVHKMFHILCLYLYICVFHNVHVMMGDFSSVFLFFVPSILFMPSWINSLVHSGIVPALWGPDHVLCSFG